MAVPLPHLFVFLATSYVLAFAPTPWPFFAVYADLALRLAPPWEGFSTVVLVVNFLSLVAALLATRRFRRALERTPITRGRALLAGVAGVGVVLVAFVLYPWVRGALAELGWRAQGEPKALVLLRMDWRESPTLHRGLVVSTSPRASRQDVGIWTLSPEETLHIQVRPEQMQELAREVSRLGYFQLPHRVDVLPSMDHSLFGITLQFGGTRRHVHAKLSSDAWERFGVVRGGVLSYLGLPEDWRWTESVPGARDYRDRSLPVATVTPAAP